MALFLLAELGGSGEVAIDGLSFFLLCLFHPLVLPVPQVSLLVAAQAAAPQQVAVQLPQQLLDLDGTNSRETRQSKRPRCR